MTTEWGTDLSLASVTPAASVVFSIIPMFPCICMLQFGGGFPEEWNDPSAVELDCPDVVNTVRIQLVRESYARL
jgi:hypothetical protein